MSRWTKDLVLREARWSALSPLSDGYGSADPAGFLRPGDPPTRRAAIATWLCDEAATAAREGDITEAALASWLGRFRPGTAATPSTSTVRYHLAGVASVLADRLGRRVGWPGPVVVSTAAEETPLQLVSLGRDVPSSAVVRQRRFRARARGALDAAKGSLLPREAILSAREDDLPHIRHARLIAREAVTAGSVADLANGLGYLAQTLNDSDDPMAAVAARWAAECLPFGSVDMYLMLNAALGILARHATTARGPHRRWAVEAANEARRALRESKAIDDSPWTTDHLRVRHHERAAQLLVDGERLGGLPLDQSAWLSMSDSITTLHHSVLDGTLRGVDRDWQAVVINRNIELNLLGLRYGLVPTGKLRGACDAASEMLSCHGHEMAVLRKAQLHRARARIFLTFGHYDLAAEAIKLGLGFAHGYPGQEQGLRDLAQLVERRSSALRRAG